MDTRFRLEQVIRKYAYEKLEKRGLYREMEEFNSILERHRVSRLFNNEEEGISFKVLNALCEYLVKECHVPEHLLPQELFGASEQDVLDLIGNTNRLQFFLGMRSARQWGPNAYVMASDAALQIELTSLISLYFATHRGKLLERADTILVDAPPRTVNAATKSEAWKRVKDTAADHYGQFLKSHDATMVATGSTKVSCVVEQVIASIFSQNAHEVSKARKAAERKVPIFVRYRSRDPQPSSCFGGLRLSNDVPSDEAGIYYERADGSWICLPCDDKQRDVGVVAYTRQVQENLVSVVCSGFSSRATHYLTTMLKELIDRFWPPQIETKDLVVGLFLVEFQFKKQPGRAKDDVTFPELEEYKVWRMDNEVIQRRLVRKT